MHEMQPKARKAGRPRSTRSGFEAVRVSLEMKRALRTIYHDYRLSSLDVAVEVLSRAWDSMPRAKQHAIVAKVLERPITASVTADGGAA